MTDESAAQSLCQACGLCCDGTLFGNVRLQPADDTSALQAAGIVLLANDTQRFFKQPCVCYQNKLCVVYASRPQSCVNFKCKLLLQYEKKEISYEHALDVIGKTLRHRDDVRAELRSLSGTRGQSLWEVYQTRNDSRGESDSAAWPKRHEHILLNHVTLLHRLQRYFGLKHEKQFVVTAAGKGDREPT